MPRDPVAAFTFGCFGSPARLSTRRKRYSTRDPSIPCAEPRKALTGLPSAEPLATSPKDPCVADANGWTPLHHAAALGRNDELKLLIAQERAFASFAVPHLADTGIVIHATGQEAPPNSLGRVGQGAGRACETLRCYLCRCSVCKGIEVYVFSNGCVIPPTVHIEIAKLLMIRRWQDLSLMQDKDGLFKKRTSSCKTRSDFRRATMAPDQKGLAPGNTGHDCPKHFNVKQDIGNNGSSALAFQWCVSPAAESMQTCGLGKAEHDVLHALVPSSGAIPLSSPSAVEASISHQHYGSIFLIINGYSSRYLIMISEIVQASLQPAGEPSSEPDTRNHEVKEGGKVPCSSQSLGAGVQQPSCIQLAGKDLYFGFCEACRFCRSQGSRRKLVLVLCLELWDSAEQGSTLGYGASQGHSCSASLLLETLRELSDSHVGRAMMLATFHSLQALTAKVGAWQRDSLEAVMRYAPQWYRGSSKAKVTPSLSALMGRTPTHLAAQGAGREVGLLLPVVLLPSMCCWMLILVATVCLVRWSWSSRQFLSQQSLLARTSRTIGSLVAHDSSPWLSQVPSYHVCARDCSIGGVGASW